MIYYTNKVHRFMKPTILLIKSTTNIKWLQEYAGYIGGML
ncbi:hypothetical protein C21_03196 [Arenibacter sp. NBRC 103722]|nr:hypothetical protein C21_03196 [Arenibacter sp. NBRC 103722]